MAVNMATSRSPSWIWLAGVLYLVLSAVCLSGLIPAPPAPQILWAAILGPPALLVWGPGAILWFAPITAALIWAILKARRSRSIGRLIASLGAIGLWSL